MCVLHPHTFEPRVVSEFTSDATAVLATLEQVLTEYGHQNANLANGACAPAALDLSRLLMYVKPMLSPSPHMSSLLRVVCVYRGNENSRITIESHLLIGKDLFSLIEPICTKCRNYWTFFEKK